MASDDEEDVMIGITREGLEEAVKAVETGSTPVCIATEVAEAIAGVGNAEQELKQMAARHGCDLQAVHILHKGDLVPGHIFIKRT